MTIPKSSYPILAGLLAAFAGGLVAFWADSVERDNLQQTQRLDVTQQVAEVRARLEGEINGTFLAMRGLAAIVSADPNISESELAKIAEKLLENDPHIRNIGLLRGTVITHNFPIEGNKAALGVDLRTRPDQWPSVKRAIETRSTVLGGPITLIQGDTALIGRVPIFVASSDGGDEDEYFGMVSVPILLDGIYRNAGIDSPDGALQVALKGRDGLGAAGDVFFGDAQVFQADPVTAEVLLPGGTWLVAAVPRAGWGIPVGALYRLRLLGVLVCAVLGALGYWIVRDLQRRREQAAALELSVRRFRAAAGHVSDLIYVWNLVDNSIDWFGDIDSLVGTAPGEFERRLGAWDELIHPDDHDRVYRMIDHSLKTGEPFDGEYRVRLKTGETRVWRDRGGPEAAPGGGKPDRWIGALLDVTEQKKIEAARAESERRLATLLDNLPGGAYRVRNDDAWTADYRSAGYRKIMGYTPDELAEMGNRGGTARLLIHPDDVNRLRAEIDGAIAEQRAFEFEYRIITKSGEERWIWERGRCVSPPSETPETLEGIVADITEHRQLQEQLQQAQKMEAVGQLTGGVAHDFNNLLAVIVGNLELAGERVEGSELREMIGSALKAADRGAALTQQLLAFSRRQTLQPESTDLNKLLRNLETLLRRTLGETISIAMQLADDLRPAKVDRAQLETAILNLALNARDAMPKGGQLTIETASVVLDELQLAPDAEPITPGRYLMIAVSDSGGGMAPEVAAQAFDPFYTTKDVGKGTGLGLAMVYGFVKQSGGYAKIYSELGHGTTIKLYLPEGDDGEPAEAAPSDSIRPEARGERVLLVEDDPEVRKLVARVLEDLGYEVLEAQDGAAAMALLQRPTERIDLLLSDVVLPGALRGQGLAEQARVLRPGLAVAFMSGYPAGALSHNGSLPSDVVFLSKPFRSDDLAKHLRQALDRASKGAKL